jgi:hypothetical protein
MFGLRKRKLEEPATDQPGEEDEGTKHPEGSDVPPDDDFAIDGPSPDSEDPSESSEVSGEVEVVVVGSTRGLDDYRSILPSRVRISAGGGISVFDGAVGQWADVRGATLRGLKMAHRGALGQDAAASSWNDDTVVVAVADGVSANGPPSATASTIAASCALDAALTHGSGPAIEIAADAVLKHAAEGRTTLLVAVVRNDPSGRRPPTVDIAGVGDCEALVLRDGEWKSIAIDPSDENVTAALPTNRTGVSWRGELCRGDVLVLASDGFAPALHDRGSSLATRLAQAWATPPAPLDFASQVAFRLEGYSDDRTAVALWLR